MKIKKRLVFDFLLLSILVALAGQAQKIAGGYRDGRPNAVEGTYSTVMSPGAGPYQSKALDLENQAYGLAKLSNQDPVKQSEKIYLLENQILRLNLDIASAPEGKMTGFERQALLALTARTYALARSNGERIFEDMIRFIDIKIPGPSGKQNRTELSDSESMYEANYRVDSDLTQAERDLRYQKHLDAFVQKGGSIKEIKTLTPTVAKNLGSYARVEYVWLLDGRIQITEGNAGHVLLAAGQPVKAAGQMIFLKDPSGKFTLLVVSNSSGNYKPDMLSVKLMANVLEKKLKIPSELVVLTKGEPMSTQAVKVYLKGEGIDPLVVKKKIAEIEVRALDIRKQTQFSAMKCGLVFSN